MRKRWLGLFLLLGGASPSPPSVDVELVRARAVASGPLFIFDDHQRPLLRVNPPLAQPPTVKWRTADGAVALACQNFRTRDGLFLECDGPGIAGHGHLEVEVTGAPSWPCQWMVPPDDRPAIHHALERVQPEQWTLTTDTLEQIAASRDRWTRVWARVAQLKLAYKYGQFHEAIRFAVKAAQTAENLEVPSEAAKRFRAAANLAGQTGRRDEARRYLERASALTPDLAHEKARLAYEQAAFYLDAENYAPAETRLWRAVRRAEAAGSLADARRYAYVLSKLYIDLGRYSDARRLLDTYRPQPDDIATAVAEHAEQRATFYLRQPGALSTSRAWAEADRWMVNAYARLRSEGFSTQAHRRALDLAWLAWKSGRPANARAWLRQARATDEASMLKAAVIEAGSQMKRDPAAARVALTTVAERLESVESPSEQLLLECRALQAEAAERAGDWEAAFDFYQRAISHQTRLSRRAHVRRSAGALLDLRSALRAKAVRAGIRAGRVAEAFEMADGLRAEIADRVRHASSVDQDASAAVLVHRQALLERIRAGCPPAGEDRTQCRRRLARALDEFGAAAAVSLQEPDRPPEFSRATLRDIRQSLPPRTGVVLVEFTGEQWVVVVLSASDIEGHEAADPWRILRRAAERFEHLFLVADHSLRAPEMWAPPLAISQIPYGGWLVEHAPPADGPPVILANPRQDLAASEKEARWVAQQWPDAIVGASPEELTHFDPLTLSKARALHFAGHSLLLGPDPWETHLDLGPRRTLGLEDLLTLKPKFRLAVLSGCETGPIGGAHQLGLPGALLILGTSTVIATVEPVRDENALRFVKALHEKRPLDAPGAAFAHAQRTLQAASDPSWRSFRLWGWP